MDQVNAEQNVGDESADRKTEQGFTPGPWRAVRKDVSSVSVGWNGEEGYIAQACFVEPLGLQVYGPDWRLDRSMAGKGHSDYICANARLIAAAPALYDRLKDLTERLKELDLQLCDDFEHPDDCDCEGEKARAVLTLVNAPECLSINNQVNDGQAS